MKRHGLTLLELAVVLGILAALASIAVLGSGAFLQNSRKDVTQQSLVKLRDVIAQTYWQDRVQWSGSVWQSALPQPNPAVSSGRLQYPQLAFLFWNPNANPSLFNPSSIPNYDAVYRCGWRGPYVVPNNGAVYTYNEATAATTNFTEQYGETGDPAVMDGWGNPIVIQCPSLMPGGALLPDGGLDVRLVSAGPNGKVDIDPATPTATLLLPGNASMTGDDVWISFELR